jgi:hypothetical protein
MTIFDLLFLLLVFTSFVTLIVAVVVALRGRGGRSLRILSRLGLCAAVYVGMVAVVGWLSPRRVLNPGDPWCFDDWCLSVEKVSSTPAPPGMAYRVSLRIFSQARRVSQRANGAWVYLIDGRGNRYAPEPDSSATRLDVLLQPGESVSASRTFNVPAGAQDLGLITGHGPAWIPYFIIGDDASLLHKPTYVRITALSSDSPPASPPRQP